MRALYKEVDVLHALERLQIDSIPRGFELVALCPGHKARTGKPDSRPSWSMNSRSGVHHCFSCGYKGTLVSLVAEILDLRTSLGNLDFDAAKDWIRGNTEVDLGYLTKQLEEMKDSYVGIPKPVEMSEARLAVFTTPPEWALAARKFQTEAVKHYGILWQISTNSWITPIRHADTGKLLGWQEKGQLERRFFNRPPGVPKSKTLFGLDAWQPGTMVVVESPLDTARLHTAGVLGGVATFGASISSEQVSLMRRAERLIIAMDNDEAGTTASLKLLTEFRKQGMECSFFDYSHTDAKDVGDMTDQEILKGIESARHCVLGKKAIL